MAKQKYIIGFLTLVILTASIYFMIPDSVRIDITPTYTIFKVMENDSWVLSGQEYTILYDGTTKMRASDRVINYTIDGNETTAYRYAYFKNDCIAKDTYIFNGSTDDVELFPVSHKIETFNCENYLLTYEVTDLEYFGETDYEIDYAHEFGHNMKVEWDEGNYYSRLYKYKNRDEGKLTVKYRVDSDYFTKNVRLYDPIISNDNVFTKLIYNKADIDKGTAIYEIENPVENLSIKDLSHTYDLAKGKGLDRIEVFAEVPVIKNITKYKTIEVEWDCSYFENNTIEEIKKICSDSMRIEDGYKLVSGLEWKQIDYLTKGKQKIKIVGYFSEISINSLDWFPVLNLDKEKYMMPKDKYGQLDSKLLIQEKWAWWNSSWTEESLVQFTAGETRTNFPISFTVNFTNGTVENCTKEVRVSNGDKDTQYKSKVLSSNYQDGYCIQTTVQTEVNMTSGTTYDAYVYGGNADAIERSDSFTTATLSEIQTNSKSNSYSGGGPVAFGDLQQDGTPDISLLWGERSGAMGTSVYNYASGLLSNLGDFKISTYAYSRDTMIGDFDSDGDNEVLSVFKDYPDTSTQYATAMRIYNKNYVQQSQIKINTNTPGGNNARVIPCDYDEDGDDQICMVDTFPAASYYKIFDGTSFALVRTQQTIGTNSYGSPGIFKKDGVVYTGFASGTGTVIQDYKWGTYYEKNGTLISSGTLDLSSYFSSERHQVGGFGVETDSEGNDYVQVELFEYSGTFWNKRYILKTTLSGGLISIVTSETAASHITGESKYVDINGDGVVERLYPRVDYSTTAILKIYNTKEDLIYQSTFSNTAIAHTLGRTAKEVADYDGDGYDDLLYGIAGTGNTAYIVVAGPKYNATFINTTSFISDSPISITLVSPANNSVEENSYVFFNATITDEILVQNVSLYIDEILNQTNTSGVNGTYLFNISMGEETHNWSILAYNNRSLSSESEARYFISDFFYPSVELNYPEDAAVYAYKPVSLNSTISDANLHECWYSLDEYSTNVSFTCGTNVTSILANEGFNTWSVCANDTAGNNNCTQTTFETDTTAPTINITYPLSGYYNATISHVDYTYSDVSPNECWYSLDGGLSNSTKVDATDETIPVSFGEGDYNLTLFCDDLFGYTSSDEENFTIDLTAPEITIISPLGETAIGFDGLVLYEISSNEPLELCNFSIDGWSTSSSMTENNATNFSLSQVTSTGEKEVLFKCYDLAFNENLSSTTITVVKEIIVESGETLTIGGDNIDFDLIWVKAGGTLNIDTAIKNLTLIAENITIDGTVNGLSMYAGGGGADSNGFSAVYGSAGIGTGHGNGGSASYSGDYSSAAGGSGAGSAVAGGGIAAYTGFRPYPAVAGGVMVGTTDNHYDLTALAGAGGGGGGAASGLSTDSNGGAGGAGAGWIILEAKDVKISGTMNMYGVNGANGWYQSNYATAGGGGGGSGGTILVKGINVNISNSYLYVQGGTGGANTGDDYYTYASNGATGAGGRLKIFGVFFENTSTTINDGTGITYIADNNTFDVQLDSPTIDELVSSPVNFTCRSLSDRDITLNIDGIANITGTGIISEMINVSDGAHNYSCNSSIFNPYDSEFVVKTTTPTVNSLSPAADYISELTSNVFSINLTDTQATLGSVSLYTNEDGTMSLVELKTSAVGLPTSLVTFTRNVNVKNLGWKIKYCDILDNCAFTEERNLQIDFTSPIINIAYPLNSSYITNVSELNFTASDSYPNTCWYSADYGVTNSTNISFSNNFTGVISSLGSNTLTVYCNDTRGNENSASITYYETAFQHDVAGGSEETNTTTTGIGNTFVALTFNPILQLQNVTYRGYNLTNGNITQYLNYSYYTEYAEQTLVSTTTPFYWDVIVYDDDNQSYVLPIRYKGVEEINLNLSNGTSNLTSELGTEINLNATSNMANVSIDIIHPDYGINYITSFLDSSLELIIDFFRKTILGDGNSSIEIEFDVPETNMFYFPMHQYDEVDSFSFNITGENTTSYPEDISFNNTNTSQIDRIYVGKLIGSNIFLDKLNTGVLNKTLYYTGKAKKLIEFFLDDNAHDVTLSFDIFGFKFGSTYIDDFSNDSILDEDQNEGMFRAGYALPKGTDLMSFVYDDFSPNGALDSLLWGAYPNALYYVCGSSVYTTDCDPGNQFEWTVANTYSGGKMTIYNFLAEDTADLNREIVTINNQVIANYTKLNTWTAQELNVKLEYQNIGDEESSQKECISRNSIVLGDVTFWSSPWVMCEDAYPSDCYDYSRTNEPLVFNISRTTSNDWSVKIQGVEEAYGDDIDDGNCGDYSIVYDYDNNLLTTTYQYPDDPGCRYSDSQVYLASEYTRSGVNWNTADQFKFNQYGNADYDDDGNEGCSDLTQTMTIEILNQSLYNLTNSSVVSSTAISADGDFSSATLDSQQIGSYIYPYLSANGGKNWESVTLGSDYSFTYAGSDIRYKYTFLLPEEGYITNSPMIIGLNITTPEDYPSNLEFDFGEDGIIDATFNGSLNLTNNPIRITIDSANISAAFDNPNPLYPHLSEIPLSVYSETPGEIYIENINLTYDPNPVSLNVDSILNFLTNSTNFTNVPIDVDSKVGNITFDDFKYDYAGGNDTIKVVAHSSDYLINVTSYLQYFYSRWDYSWVPEGVEWIYFAPISPTAQNVTPYGQTSDVQIIDITNYGYSDVNATLSIYVNGSNPCVNTTLSLDNVKSNGTIINESWTELANLSYLETTPIFLWSDYNCSYDNWYLYEPQYIFRQCVNNGVCSEKII